MAKSVCVIGGGAAGLMAAHAAAENGHQVTLFEKNEKLGKKIYITGKGRCNFTNDTSSEDFLQNVVRGKKFLTGAIYSFSPQKTIDFFEKYGMAVKIERGNRAFPVSDHASDVTKTLEKACKMQNVTIKIGEKVEKINTITSNTIPMSDIERSTTPDIKVMSHVVGVKTDKNDYRFDSVVVATGGLSYPSTGSTGDGYRFAYENGLKVTDLKCGLCGLNLKGDFFGNLQGLALKNVALTVNQGKKCVYSEFGELLFTHFGISGPIVLSASSVINRMDLAGVEVYLDLKPALDEQTLDKRLLRDFEKYKNKKVSNALVELLPQKMIPILLQNASISEEKPVNVLTKEERGRLVATLKKFPLRIRSLRGFEEAIITSGGVDLSEINPKTMESKKVSGLYFCGEVLDVDAFTGGFNLQIAFATGYAAGRNIK
ncbi:MAG: NAD(P)/FAD-dependent oxidoreductase [Clostridia bacterium]|nr:NAD(P)/FAD-dependent oxidoreductase [Clostridia bacterium]